MRRGSGPGGGAPPTPGEISGPMMAQYLFALLGGMPRRHGAGEDPFGAMFSPESGRMGDFVFSEQALDQIVSELMENSNAHRPVPATDEVTEKLPKEVLVDGCKLTRLICKLE
jgi:E3 ubiquitin-protein ligase RNF115/126